MNWLIGKRVTHTPHSKMVEEWVKANDSTLKGKSYRMRENDSTLPELIEIRKEGSDIFYIPTVKVRIMNNR